MKAETRVSTKSLDLYAEEAGLDLWFPQTIDEYFASLIEDQGTNAPLIIHLFREILVDVKSVPDYFPPAMEEGDTVENDWLPKGVYFVAGIHDYGYWFLKPDGPGYYQLVRYERTLGCNPVEKTISFRPCGVVSRTSEIDREI